MDNVEVAESEGRADGKIDFISVREVFAFSGADDISRKWVTPD